MNKRSEVKRTGVSRFLSISPLIGLLIGRGIKAAGLCLFMASFLASCGGLSVPTTWPEGRSTTSSQPVGPARKLPETSPRASKSTPKTTSNPPQTRAASPVTRDLYPYSSPSDARPAAPALPPSSQTLAAPPRERTVPQEQFAPPPVPQPPPAERAVPQREEPVTPSFTPLLNRSAPSVSTEPDQSPQMPPPPPMKTSSVRVALVLPLTGPNAKIGQAMLNAAQLALFSFSEKTFELLVHDTKGTPEGALDAVQLSIGDGARLILGPLLSASVKAIAPSARAANVPVVAFSSDRSVAGEGVFTLGFIPSAEVWRVVRYARKRGVQRFAALAPSTAYGETVLETFREAVERSGGSVVRVEMYEPHAQDYAPLIRDLADYETRRGALLAQRNSLKERDDELSRRALKRLEKLQTVGPVPFDALFLADGGKRLQAIAALLPFYDIDPAKVRMLGTGQWDEPGIGREPALVGGWYAAPPPNARANFDAQYRKVYGRRPPRLATLAYDATALATVLARNPDGPKFTFKALTTPSGFTGRDGIFRLLQNGLPERGLSVLQIGPRTHKVISPAPDSFSESVSN